MTQKSEKISDLADAPYLRCRSCSWCHVATASPEPALNCCFRCRGVSFEIAEEESVPRGVTLQGLRWPRDDVFDDFGALVKIAETSFAKAARKAIAENDACGIESPGIVRGKTSSRITENGSESTP